VFSKCKKRSVSGLVNGAMTHRKHQKMVITLLQHIIEMSTGHRHQRWGGAPAWWYMYTLHGKHCCESPSVFTIYLVF